MKKIFFMLYDIYNKIPTNLVVNIGFYLFCAFLIAMICGEIYFSDDSVETFFMLGIYGYTLFGSIRFFFFRMEESDLGIIKFITIIILMCFFLIWNFGHLIYS
tara:strand:- start:94 stop:402 length:309 start_codon:yes stop_codon:yes gene_type:complete